MNAKVTPAPARQGGSWTLSVSPEGVPKNQVRLGQNKAGPDMSLWGVHQLVPVDPLKKDSGTELRLGQVEVDNRLQSAETVH